MGIVFLKKIKEKVFEKTIKNTKQNQNIKNVKRLVISEFFDLMLFYTLVLQLFAK